MTFLELPVGAWFQFRPLSEGLSTRPYRKEEPSHFDGHLVNASQDPRPHRGGRRDYWLISDSELVFQRPR